MKVISLYNKLKKHKGWFGGEGKPSGGTRETTGKTLWFEREVSCKICGLDISVVNLGRWDLSWDGVTDDNEVKFFYLYESGWERVDLKPCGVKGKDEILKGHYYLCPECRRFEAWGQKQK
jgi:hypothetical protein